ncbi:MAG: DCC1-like thiol-disulfide oxidoreductase family protein [Filomicrobium sp.]
MRLKQQPYSYLHDPSVPAFEAGDVFTVMDAHCALCARGAAWISRYDKAHEFKIVPMQSDVGAALFSHFGLDPNDPASWLYVENGNAYSSLDALIRVGARLGGVWKGLALLRILPSPIQDALYRWVARNRYRMFGTTDLCNLPNPEVQKRLLQ